MSTPSPDFAVLMVCTGNICRSPTAEAVLRHRLQRVGAEHRVRVDSAGTYAGHAGAPPDERSIAHAARRGYDLSGQRARPVDVLDFDQFDLILALDEGHLRHLLRICPEPRRKRVRLLMSFAAQPGATGAGGGSVPDPYYGGAAGFEHVLDLVEQACDGLMEYLHSAKGPLTADEPGSAASL